MKNNIMGADKKMRTIKCKWVITSYKTVPNRESKEDTCLTKNS